MLLCRRERIGAEDCAGAWQSLPSCGASQMIYEPYSEYVSEYLIGWALAPTGPDTVVRPSEGGVSISSLLKGQLLKGDFTW